jgi:RNA recognition motif-containing protein
MNIYVGNLNPSTNEGHLRELFQPFGKITSVKILMDHGTGLSKCFGFVEMDVRNDGNQAISRLNNMNFMSHFLEVNEARPNSNTRPGQNFSFRVAEQAKKAANNK